MSEFLCSESRPLDYCSSVLENGQSYNGFALVTADLRYQYQLIAIRLGIPNTIQLNSSIFLTFHLL